MLAKAKCKRHLRAMIANRFSGNQETLRDIVCDIARSMQTIVTVSQTQEIEVMFLA